MTPPADKREAAVADFQGFVHQRRQILRRQAPDHQFNRVFVIAAQGHTFFEQRHAAIDAGLFESFFQCTGQHVFMKTLAPENLGGQHCCPLSGITLTELLDDSSLALGC